MTDEFVQIRRAVKSLEAGIEARIPDRYKQQISEDEAEIVRDFAEDIKNRKLQESQNREALRKNPKWQQLFDNSRWKWLESQLAKVEALRAEACRECNGRARHYLSPDEQKGVDEVQLPFDQLIDKIKTSMFKMKSDRGLIETINLLWQGRDILSSQDLLEAVRDYLPAVEMLESLGRGRTFFVEEKVKSYRQAAERIRLQQPELRELLPWQDTPSEELRNLKAWAEAMVDKNLQKVGSREQDNKKSDQADESGYVQSPSDPTAYIPAAKIIADYCDGLTVVPTPKILGEVVEKYAKNRVRWTRPLNKKTGKPMKNRRSVHLTDWNNYVQSFRSTRAARDGFPNDPDMSTIETRKRQVREQKLGK